jgi:hypothetical protein
MNLVDIQRDDVDRRRMKAIVDPVTFQKTGDDIVGVGPLEVGGGESGNLQARPGALGKRHGRHLHELSTSHVAVLSHAAAPARRLMRASRRGYPGFPFC